MSSLSGLKNDGGGGGGAGGGGGGRSFCSATSSLFTKSTSESSDNADRLRETTRQSDSAPGPVLPSGGQFAYRHRAVKSLLPLGESPWVYAFFASPIPGHYVQR